MSKSVLLCGAGGYGANYVRLLRDLADAREVVWAGVVDPFAASSSEYAVIESRQIPVYDDMESFYAHHTADLAIVSSPIAFHCPQSIAAMCHGSDVLVEKPLCATLEEAEALRSVRDETGRRVWVGFQWSYNPVMLQLKRMSDAGAFGRLRRLRSLVLWPRAQDYYLRNSWAGKEYDAAGRPVFDSISANATAHYLFNMLWMAGEGYRGATPHKVEASLGRANAIETFDTATIRVTLPGGVEALHVASHAAGSEHVQNPMFLYEYEHANVLCGGYGQDLGDITIEYADGRRENLGNSHPDTASQVYHALRENVPDNDPCPIEAAEQHVRVLEMVRKRGVPIRQFDGVLEEQGTLCVPGLANELKACYTDFRLLGEV